MTAMLPECCMCDKDALGRLKSDLLFTKQLQHTQSYPEWVAAVNLFCYAHESCPVLLCTCLLPGLMQALIISMPAGCSTIMMLHAC